MINGFSCESNQIADTISFGVPNFRRIDFFKVIRLFGLYLSGESGDLKLDLTANNVKEKGQIFGIDELVDICN
jgi:hypothetical protein